MPSRIDTQRALAAIDEKRLLDLEQRSIRTPSSTFEEGALADLYADYMTHIGLDVEMQHIADPAYPTRSSRQPIGRLKGSGGGPTLLINGHMDPGVEMSGWSVDPYGAKFEDGWIWGMGAHDDKGGCVAALCALEAIVRSETRLKGDVLMTPVIAHKLGGAGTRALLQRGVTADLHQHGALQQHHRQRLRGRRHGAAGVLGARAVLPLQPRGARRLHQPDRTTNGDRAAHRSEPDADSRPRLDDVQAPRRAAGFPHAHLRRDAQGALLLQERDRALEPGMRADPRSPDRRSRPSKRTCVACSSA